MLRRTWDHTRRNCGAAALILVIMLLAPIPVSADLEAGKAAYGNYDYQRAYELLLPLADAGDAEAQYTMSKIVLQIFRNQRSKAMERAFHYLELAAKQGHTTSQIVLAGFYVSTFSPDSSDKAFVWALRAVANGKDTRGYSTIIGAYCYGPDYQRNLELAAAWKMLETPDAAFAQPSDWLDNRWEEVRTTWENDTCFDMIEITKAFVRRAHQRAMALAKAYGLRIECLGFPFCPNVESLK